jgi:uncharacterized protein (TIGR02001 family)
MACAVVRFRARIVSPVKVVDEKLKWLCLVAEVGTVCASGFMSSINPCTDLTLEKTMNVRTSKSLIAVILAAGCAAAFAQAAEPDYTLSYNLGATTDYRYRGISQSGIKPAVQGGVDFAHKSGAYLGAWASTITWTKDSGGGGNVELDVYGGYKFAMGDLSYDLGALAYAYPGNKLAVSANTTELYGAVTYGAFTAKYSHAITNLFGVATSKNSNYLDVSATFDLGNGLTVTPHIGNQFIKNGDSYTDLSVTVSKDYSGLVVSAALVGNTGLTAPYTLPGSGTKDLGRSGLVLSVKKNF